MCVNFTLFCVNFTRGPVDLVFVESPQVGQTCSRPMN